MRLSNYKKPDAITTMNKDEYRDKAWPLPISDLLYVGSATNNKLQGIGIRTIGDLARTEETLLVRKLGKMGSYNNSKAELDELNDILKETKAYDINFNDVTRDGDLIRRSFSLIYTAPDYDKAADIITQLCEGEWRCLISDLQFIADKDNLEEGDVKVGVTATFYETMEGGTPDSGLPADTSETSDISGTSVDW